MQTLSSVVLALAIAGCTGASSTGIAERSCPTDSSLSYANFGQSFMSNNCLQCHDHQSPVLTTQTQVQASAAAILDQAVYTDAMPKAAGMDIAEREMLGEWLSCGAP